MSKKIPAALLAIVLLAPSPFVSGVYYVCGISGHVLESCASSPISDHTEVKRQSCCDSFSTPDLTASVRGDVSPMEKPLSGEIFLSRAGLFTRSTSPDAIQNRRPQRAPPPSAKNLRILLCSFLA